MQSLIGEKNQVLHLIYEMKHLKHNLKSQNTMVWPFINDN